MLPDLRTLVSLNTYAMVICSALQIYRLTSSFQDKSVMDACEVKGCLAIIFQTQSAEQPALLRDYMHLPIP